MFRLNQKTHTFALISAIALVTIPFAAPVSATTTEESMAAEYEAFYEASHQQPKVVPYQRPMLKDAKLSGALRPEEIIKVANQVANWQLNQFDIRSNMLQPERRSSGLPEGWIYGAHHVGLMAWAEASEQSNMLRAIYNLALLNEWRLGPRAYNADDHVIGDVYLDLYEIFGGEEKFEEVQKVFDFILKHPSPVSLKFDKSEVEEVVGAHRNFRDPIAKQRWCWADAIFMAPPVWVHLAQITDDQRYLEFMNNEFWETTDYLYDKEQKLYLRDSRYFVEKDKQGRPIFWGRGNGWVYAGLARILEYLPDNYKDRPRYEAIFKDMGKRLEELQLPDGSWPSSLLEREEYSTPESSGTGLLTFAFAWGINNGLLEEDMYRPVVEQAWQSLVECVSPSGRVGWVQQVSFAPGSATDKDTELYGTGALLLAASEVLKLAQTD
jgi:rhamnogalacturonyl hydrolase YesR